MEVAVTKRVGEWQLATALDGLVRLTYRSVDFMEARLLCARRRMGREVLWLAGVLPEAKVAQLGEGAGSGGHVDCVSAALQGWSRGAMGCHFASKST